MHSSWDSSGTGSSRWPSGHGSVFGGIGTSVHGGYLTPSSATVSWGTASTPGTEQAADQGDMRERPAERPSGRRIAAGERVQVAVQRVCGGTEQVGLVLSWSSTSQASV